MANVCNEDVLVRTSVAAAHPRRETSCKEDDEDDDDDDDDDSWYNRCTSSAGCAKSVDATRLLR